jgi:MFS family permease
MRRVARIPSMPHAMLVSLTVLTSIDILVTYLPIYGEQNGLSVQLVGYLLAVRAGASIASRLFMAPMIRRTGRRRLLVLSLVAPAAALAVFPVVPLAGQVAAMVVVGLGLGLGQPVTLSWVAATAPRELLGTALGMRLSGNRLGQAALPVVIGALAAATGVTAVFVALAAMLAGSSSLLLRARFDDDPPQGSPR